MFAWKEPYPEVDTCVHLNLTKVQIEYIVKGVIGEINMSRRSFLEAYSYPEGTQKVESLIIPKYESVNVILSNSDYSVDGAINTSTTISAHNVERELIEKAQNRGAGFVSDEADRLVEADKKGVPVADSIDLISEAVRTGEISLEVASLAADKLVQDKIVSCRRPGRSADQQQILKRSFKDYYLKFINN